MEERLQQLKTELAKEKIDGKIRINE